MDLLESKSAAWKGSPFACGATLNFGVGFFPNNCFAKKYESRAEAIRPAFSFVTGSKRYLTNTDMVTLTVWPPGP